MTFDNNIIPRANRTTASDTAQSVQKIIEANETGRTYEFFKNEQGIISVNSAQSKWKSLLLTIKNFWNSQLQEALASQFLAESLSLLSQPSQSLKAKQNIIKILRPLVSNENKTIFHISTVFERVLDHQNRRNKFNLKEEVRSKIAEYERQLGTDQQSTPAEEAAFSYLQEKFNTNQPITLFDTKPFLAYAQRVSLEFSDFWHEHKIERMLEQLDAYFERTHQHEGFEELRIAERQKTLLTYLNNNLTISDILHDFSIKGRQLSLLCSQVVTDIQNKRDHQPSIHGHSRDIFTRNDLYILQKINEVQRQPNGFFWELDDLQNMSRSIYRTIESEIDHAKEKLNEYLPFFQEIARTTADIFKANATNTLTNEQMKTIVAAKQTLMELELSIGRTLDLSILKQNSGITPALKTGLAQLQALDTLRGEQIDTATFQSFIAEHYAVDVHSKVAIEGGGPTGLLLAITQFKVGADVSLFEKRSTIYDRTQIVRLDPKWMCMLKFYLGEDYYTLFTDSGHRGIIRSDGFGEIATMYLEDSLHMRLTRLIAMLPQEPGKNPAIERFAAHELTGITQPANEGGLFRAIATYNTHYDIASEAAKAETPATIEREIDHVICAGGKNSPIKDQFLPSSIAVTRASYYGVCSWVAPRIAGQNLEKMDLFQDFRGMLAIDQQFKNRFDEKLSTDFAPEGILGSAIDERFRRYLNRFIHHSFEYSNFRHFGPFMQNHVQTRTFENNGLIYIGMEVPHEIKNILNSLDNTLDREIEMATQEEKNSLSQQKNAVLTHFKQCWFQCVMESYGLDQSNGIIADTMDHKFAAMFSVDQHRMKEDELSSLIEKGDSRLLVTAAGDAFASPHFMRYSGLTGARENILQLQNYTQGMAATQNSVEEDRLREILESEGDRTASFVIARGEAFLPSKSSFEISDERTHKMRELLNREVAKTAQQAGNYRLRSRNSWEYVLTYQGNEKIIYPEDGYLVMQSDDNHHGLVETHYQSFEQIKLELGL